MLIHKNPMDKWPKYVKAKCEHMKASYPDLVFVTCCLRAVPGKVTYKPNEVFLDCNPISAEHLKLIFALIQKKFS